MINKNFEFLKLHQNMSLIMVSSHLPYKTLKKNSDSKHPSSGRSVNFLLEPRKDMLAKALTVRRAMIKAVFIVELLCI